MSMPLKEMPKRLIIELDDVMEYSPCDTIRLEDTESGVIEEWVVMSVIQEQNSLDILFSREILSEDL